VKTGDGAVTGAGLFSLLISSLSKTCSAALPAVGTLLMRKVLGGGILSFSPFSI
jgi:hypothetical protein